MTTKTRFASSRIILLGLAANLVSLSAQADIVGVNSLPLPVSSTFATSLMNVDPALDKVPLMEQPGPLLPLYEVLYSAADFEQVYQTTVYIRQKVDDLAQGLELTPLPLNAGQAAGDVLHGVSNTIGNVGDLVRNNPDNPYPISNTLTDLTGSLVNATGALLQGSVQAPANNGLLNGLVNNNPGNTNLLSPVTNLVNAAGGDLINTNTSNDGLLAPVGNLLGGLAGGLPDTPDSNNGLLTPVTGLLGNISTSPVNKAQASLPADSSTTTAANGGLLGPVTGLLSGLLGGAPH
ncbi:hypothetical protein MID00_13690 [Alcaligenes sp. NLF5-7]|nr:hypothetical protein [Alcaligenes sp. NLF5-7]UTM00548.1 hypothetical protein MID00_13690 [Alcaligenes sp. NLF5-7]